jgi:hypothetical protein
MTEAEWQACEDPEQMLLFLQGKASNRKLRLFAVACCRRIWHAMPEPSLKGIEASERYADGEIDLVALREGSEAAKAAWNASTPPAHQLFQEWGVGDHRANAAVHATDAAYRTMWSNIEGSPFENEVEIVWYICWRVFDATYLLSGAAPDRDWERHLASEERTAGRILGDIFGDPFRPVRVNPDWLTSTVVALASQMYESRDFSAMPILADALQDAGCDNADILDHCRSPGEHVRGCWVVDLVLGKS